MVVSRSQTLYLTATLGRNGMVALLHSTSSIPSSCQGGIVAVPVVVVSNLGLLLQPLNQLFFTVPRLPRMCYNRGIGQ